MDTKNVSKDFFGRENLERLARDPRNEVYTYEHETLTHRVPAKEVEAMCRLTRQEALEIKAAHPRWGRTETRLELLRRHPEYETTFCRTHPNCFDTSADPSTDEKNFTRLLFLIYMKERQDTGLITEDLASFSVNNFLLQEFRQDDKAPKPVVALPESSSIPQARF
jgi:hypothetical protein